MESAYFSIIVPIYNSEDFLKKCLDSIIMQSFTDYEVILIDDGSTDSSLKICREYEKIDVRFKVFTKKNGGASSARNLGIENSSGKYLIFLDSDDFWINDWLGKAEKKLIFEKDTEVLFLQTSKLKKSGEFTDSVGYKFDVLNQTQLYEYISKQKKVSVSACLKVTKKSLFTDRELYFQESLLAEDIDWFFKLITKANFFSSLDCPVYCYRIRENSISRTADQKRLNDYTQILEKWFFYTNDNEEMNEKDKWNFFNMLGYEYEILLANYYDYEKSVRVDYKEKLEKLFVLLNYRSGKRSELIKIIYNFFGFNFVCLVLNVYLNKLHYKKFK